MANAVDGGRRQERLRSWKEIAAFFGTDERTVRRWEERGLPVHRLPGQARSTIYADVEELQAWLKGPQENGAAELAEPVAGAAVSAKAPAGKRVGLVALVTGLVVVGGAGVWLAVPGSNEPASEYHKPSQRAVDLYSAAAFQLDRATPESLRRAVELYGRAIAEDPAFAEAYAGLSAAYMRLRVFAAMPESEAYPRARAAAERALELDPNLAHAHAAMGMISFYSDWNFERGLYHFREVTRLAPSEPTGRYQYGMALLTAGDFAGALREIDAAQRLDPRSRGILADRGFLLYLLGRRREGVALIQQVAADDPDFMMSHHYLTLIHFSDGNFPAGLDQVRIVSRMRQDADRIALVEEVSRAFDRGGRDAMFRTLLAGQKRLNRQGREPTYVLAETYALLGDRDSAFDYLRRSIEARESVALTMRFDPLLRNLRSDPRFRQLAERIGRT